MSALRFKALVIRDSDNRLVDLRDVHRVALDEAEKTFKIDKNHLKIVDCIGPDPRYGYLVVFACPGRKEAHGREAGRIEETV